MARRNTESKNSPYKIDSLNYTNTDAISATTGQSGSPRNNTSIWEKLNSMCFDVEWTVAEEDTNAVVVTAQLLDLKGRNLGRYASVHWSLHVSDAAGASHGAIDTASTGLTVSTGTSFIEHTADSIVLAQTDSDGKLVTSVAAVGADFYKVQITVGDRVFQSPLLTFAA